VGAWRECQALKGYAALRKSFDVDDAMLGCVNGFPESLHVTLRATQEGLVNAVWWWDPIDSEGNLTYDWLFFSQVYREASKVIAKQSWLVEWRNTSPGRLVELHAFGGAIGEPDFDMNTFILPLWREAGLQGDPEYSLLLRRSDTAWAKLYVGTKEARGLITSVSEPEGSPAHWLDGLHMYFHPRCKPDDESSRFVVVQPSGEWEQRIVKRCEP